MGGSSPLHHLIVTLMDVDRYEDNKLTRKNQVGWLLCDPPEESVLPVTYAMSNFRRPTGMKIGDNI